MPVGGAEHSHSVEPAAPLVWVVPPTGPAGTPSTAPVGTHSGHCFTGRPEKWLPQEPHPLSCGFAPNLCRHFRGPDHQTPHCPEIWLSEEYEQVRGIFSETQSAWSGRCAVFIHRFEGSPPKSARTPPAKPPGKTRTPTEGSHREHRPAERRRHQHHYAGRHRRDGRTTAGEADPAGPGHRGADTVLAL